MLNENKPDLQISMCNLNYSNTTCFLSATNTVCATELVKSVCSSSVAFSHPMQLHTPFNDIMYLTIILPLT